MCQAAYIQKPPRRITSEDAAQEEYGQRHPSPLMSPGAGDKILMYATMRLHLLMYIR
jgi:hypothetical protein